jgi:hypothetical protein
MCNHLAKHTDKKKKKKKKKKKGAQDDRFLEDVSV